MPPECDLLLSYVIKSALAS